MKKTYREVIADIKEGEVWKSKYRTITCKNNEIRIVLESSCIEVSFNEYSLYVLQGKECTFQEAFVSYEEGKEIESCVNGEIFCKKSEHGRCDRLFNASQIRGKWYING